MHFLAQRKLDFGCHHIFSHSPMSVVTKRSSIILKKDDVEKEIKEEVTMGSKLYISMLQLSKIATNSIKSWYSLIFVCYHIHTFI